MDLTPFAAFIVATTIGLGLSLATFIVARKSGLSPVQDELIGTLKDNSSALTLRVAQLEEEVSRERARRIELEMTLTRLRDAVADLVAENADLRRRLKLPPRVGADL